MKQKKNIYLSIRFNKTENMLFEARARELKMSKSDYIRFCFLTEISQKRGRKR